MSRSERTARLFEDVVRLRRVERRVPGDEDLRTVRAGLEDQLGPTVTRSQAARLLGLSHTALQRWEKTGDLPLVITPSGRKEVPVASLIDLYEAVDAERSSGRRRRHTLEPVLTQGRRRAARLDAAGLVASERQRAAQTGRTDRHEIAQLRSLAYHRAIAQRLDRSMVDDARRVLWDWRRTGKITSGYADGWDQILDRPLPEIRRAIGQDTETARDLRQNSPFAGMLSEPERRTIIEAVS